MLGDRERAEVRSPTQRDFISDAGHELRTPITIIRGHLELLGDDPEDRHRPSRSGSKSCSPGTASNRAPRRTVELTAREFAVAEVLLRHPDQVLSREQLLNLVWETDRHRARYGLPSHGC